ncbi:MAG TPA: HAMP domain-containing sensor histidine kinase, partial [Candidatus Dormibacteraeota bacterium]
MATAAAVANQPRPPTPIWLLGSAVLAAAVLVADLRPISAGPQQKTSLAAGPALLAAFLVPATFCVPMVAAAAALANLLLRRRPRVLVLNTGSVTLATASAAGIGAIGSDPGLASVIRAAAGGLLFVAITTSVPAFASAISRGKRWPTVLAAAWHDSWPAGLAMAGIAVASATLWIEVPWAAWLPLALLPAVQRTHQLIASERASREQLERQMIAQRRFLTDVSHNLGNPVATIRTNLGLLHRAHLPPGLDRAAEDAAAEAERLSELFKRLRVLAETDDGVPLDLQSIDFSQIASDLVRAYTGPAAARQIHLDRVVEGPVPAFGDHELLRQAAANLVENAIKFSPDGSRVTIRVRSQEHRPCLEVIDSGPGIEPDRMDAIFERFEHGPEGGSG